MMSGISQEIKKILEEPFWLHSLETRMTYRRLHDDHDGAYSGHIEVMFGPDGDAWVSVSSSKRNENLRFRMFSGGGKSLRVRNALLILAEAIRLDNEEHPIDEPLPNPVPPPPCRFIREGDDKPL
jgi:hypothetical protein